MTGPNLRASDEDRQRTVRALELHAGAGRLSLDEYSERVDLVLAARTHGELDSIVRDLPVVPDPADDPDEAPVNAHAHLGGAFLIALLALLLIGALLVIGR